MQDAARDEVKLLRTGLLSAETQRDQLLLRLQALHAAAAASSDPAMQAALSQDAQAAAVAAREAHAGDAQPAGSPAGDAAALAAAEAAAATDESPSGADAAPTAADVKATGDSVQQEQDATAGLLADVGVVASLRARVSELESELRQVREGLRQQNAVHIFAVYQ